MSRALILMYHLVDAPQSAKEHRFCTPPDEFARQMRYLREAFDPITLDAMLAGLRGEAALPARPVHVTFDDGFTGVLDHAAAVLAELSIPATLFAVSARLGMSNDWMSSRGFPARRLMTGAQLRELESAGFTIGSHTRSHARLTQVDAAGAGEEIAVSKRELQEVLGKEVRHFAYPYGLHNDAVRAAVVDAGYDSASSTVSGFNRHGEDAFRLRRIDVFGTDRLWQFRQKLRFGRNESSRLFTLQYYVGRAAARLRRG